MAASSRWDVMKMEDPGDRSTALAAHNLVVANAKTVAACRTEAAKIHKPQECRINVRVPK